MAFHHEMILDTQLHNPEWTQGNIPRTAERILRELAKQGDVWLKVSQEALAKRLRTHWRTIMRNLNMLEERGIIKRTRGRKHLHECDRIELVLPDTPYITPDTEKDAKRYFSYTKEANLTKCQDIPDQMSGSSIENKVLKEKTNNTSQSEVCPVDSKESGAAESVDQGLVIKGIPEIDKTTNLTSTPKTAILTGGKIIPEVQPETSEMTPKQKYEKFGKPKKAVSTRSSKEILEDLHSGKMQQQTYSAKRNRGGVTKSGVKNAIKVLERVMAIPDNKRLQWAGSRGFANVSNLEALAGVAETTRDDALRMCILAVQEWAAWSKHLYGKNAKQTPKTFYSPLSQDNRERLIEFANKNREKLDSIVLSELLNTTVDTPTLQHTTQTTTSVTPPSRNKEGAATVESVVQGGDSMEEL
ncbi:hypothetical protein VH22019_00105 [Vibrio phage VH2_2019]|nr:hypothetical protein VH22019_00105 [Vibrio phage VH2_2019]